MSLLAAVRVVLHDKTCFYWLSFTHHSMWRHCCVVNSLLIMGCRLKKIEVLIFFGICLGMFAVAILCALSVCICTFAFDYLCKFRFRCLGQRAATVWDCDSYCLLITQAAAWLVFANTHFTPFDYAASPVPSHIPSQFYLLYVWLAVSHMAHFLQ